MRVGRVLYKAVIWLGKLKKLQEAKIVKIANDVYCLESFVFKSTFNKRRWDGDGCMAVSRHSEVSSWLPRLGHWVPGKDRGEVVLVAFVAAGDVEDIVDGGGSQSVPWWRKLSALHLPPLQLAATWVDGHLVVTDLIPIFIINIDIWTDNRKSFCLSISPKRRLETN